MICYFLFLQWPFMAVFLFMKHNFLKSHSLRKTTIWIKIVSIKITCCWVVTSNFHVTETNFYHEYHNQCEEENFHLVTIAIYHWRLLLKLTDHSVDRCLLVLSSAPTGISLAFFFFTGFRGVKNNWNNIKQKYALGKKRAFEKNAKIILFMFLFIN